MRILIVDDSRAMQTIVRRGIEQLGYDNLELKKAENGKDALNIIRVWEPELVLSDWHMPEMNGIELLKALNREMLGINIGFVTTESSDARIQEALDAGAQFVVQKPFDFKTLHEAVLPILQGSSESEQTLNDPQVKHTHSDHILLPSLETLGRTLNQSPNIEIQIKKISPLTLKDKQFPYLLGLYGDAKHKAVHAIAIADLNAACILGVSLGYVSEESAHIAQAERALPKIIMENCRQVLKNIEVILFNNERKTHLTLRNANLMRKQNDSVNKLLKKEGDERLDVGIMVDGLEAGRFTLIIS
ncbi:hypothetical protein AB835_10745 [Candidatus Endobugula sertula]|uniref:Response regulatory domain-containing protein n=1 Tax=Candidatus Endobugula sertula TaxID=62101 RepID=A0A1D2QNE8_9GAMM|nr:hypothetical protein AB835_10745 [Candidatus Endobugula sertula]